MTQTMTPQQRLLATVRGEPHDRVPFTPIVMQWAAHHIGVSYRDYCLEPKHLAAAQVAVARDFQTDWVCAISDPWCESSAYGMVFDWPEEGVGVPRGHFLQSRDDLRKLEPFDPHRAERPRKRLAAIAAEKQAVNDDIIVCGWIEGPIAQYADLRGLQDACMDLIDDPSMFHAAAEVIVENAIRFATAQVKAGADIIGVGDAAASVIGPQLYAEHVLPWERKLFAGIHDAGCLVKLHICGDINPLLPYLADVGADILDCDHMVPLDRARQIVGEGVTLCGNFDPVSIARHGTPEAVEQACRRCIAEAGGPTSRFILQPGCEIPQGTPRANVQAMSAVAAAVWQQGG